MKIYNVTHTSDLDGMASAALLVRQYKVPLRNVFFSNYGGELFEHCMDAIKNLDGGGNLLVISDIAAVDSILDGAARALSAFKKKGNRIIWLDHHSCNDNAVKRLSKICDLMVVGENIKYCGAELVYKFLCKRDKYGDELTRITHLSDFALNSKSKHENELIIRTSMALKSIRNNNTRNPRLREFVSCIAKGNIDCKVMNDAYNKYMRTSRPYLKKMLESSKVIEINGVRIAIGFGTRISQQEACMELYKNRKTQVAVYIAKDTHQASIRSIRDSKSWGIVSVAIAEHFSGGGHPLASGFTLGKRDLSKRKAQQRLVQEITAVAKKLYGNKIKYYQQDTGKYAMR